jgi:hypothetical protein
LVLDPKTNTVIDMTHELPPIPDDDDDPLDYYRKRGAEATAEGKSK